MFYRDTTTPKAEFKQDIFLYFSAEIFVIVRVRVQYLQQWQLVGRQPDDLNEAVVDALLAKRTVPGVGSWKQFSFSFELWFVI
jgi:hypothetical protein